MHFDTWKYVQIRQHLRACGKQIIGVKDCNTPKRILRHQCLQCGQRFKSQQAYRYHVKNKVTKHDQRDSSETLDLKHNQNSDLQKV